MIDPEKMKSIAAMHLDYVGISQRGGSMWLDYLRVKDF